MNFHELSKKLQENFQMMQPIYGTGFVTDADKDVLWSTYLESFPKRINPIFRKRREFDCSCCRHFIKQIGGIVFLDPDLRKHTLWEFRVDDPDYQVVLDAMDAYVKSKTIQDVFLTHEFSIGTKQSRFLDGDRNIVTFEHFWLPVPTDWTLRHSYSIDTERGRKRDLVHVFYRSLREISTEAIDTVAELIASNTLYRGSEWKTAIKKLSLHKSAFSRLPEDKQMLYAWRNADKAGIVVGKIRNHSIGVLLTDISDGVELNEAVTRYERIVAPANYKRPKAIFTAKMLEAAKQKITDLGYMDSLQRRYAKLDDITVNNILFSNKDAAKRIKGGVFDDLLADAKTSPKSFDRVEEIPVEKFISDVLPGAREVEAYVENRHAANMVSLIAPSDRNAPSMFKWANSFSWAYTGNVTDSVIRENVKRAGGSVDGVLRFSIQWNDGSEYSKNDLDAHCHEPCGGSHIYYMSKFSRLTSGQLDVDIINPDSGTPAVENITWPEKHKMIPGDYKFSVHQFTNRGGRDGFRAEIAFDGQTYSFDYPRELRQEETVPVATVHLDRNGKFSISPNLPTTLSSKDLWNIKTMTFVPVTVVMFSPNYWDEQSGVGNKHYFFMLNGAVNPERPNGFYNEFLKQDLLEHKRVLEALGGKLAVADAEDQLSGLGFSSTLRNNLVVKVKGATERVMKILF